MDPPVGHRAPGHVAGADHDVEPLAQGSEKVGERGRVVLQVAVHLHEGVEPTMQAPREPVPVGAAEARLARPPQHVDPPELLTDSEGEVSGAVGAGVVDDQDVGLTVRVTNAPEHGGDVLGLLVGRKDDEDLHGRAAYGTTPGRW